MYLKYYFNMKLIKKLRILLFKTDPSISIYTYSTSQLGLATFQLLKSHMCLVATTLHSMVLEYSLSPSESHKA